MSLLFLLSIPTLAYIGWDTLGVLLSIINRLQEKKTKANQSSPTDTHIAILYPTSDDFDESACSSLLKQQNVSFDLFILDDSTQENEKEKIDQWATGQSQSVQVIRRADREGFKGGNINNWLKKFGSSEKYPYFLLVDADEFLTPDFTEKLLARIVETSYAFVQAGHFATAQLETYFQKTLNLQVTVDQMFQLPAWNFSDVAPIIGHGVIIRTQNLKDVGGFPNVVSEDLALTIILGERGLFGHVVTDLFGFEVFPQTYKSYWRRRRRWVQADTEMLRKFLPVIWRAGIHLTSKIRLTVRELRLPLLSTYWILCALIALKSLTNTTPSVTVSPWWWLALPLILLPSLPALVVKDTPFMRRILYVLSIPIVGLAASSITPIATLTGFKKRQVFIPTGSRAATANPQSQIDGWLSWELIVGLLFVSGGFLSNNLPLTAVGIAVLASPALRTRAQTPLLILLTVAFWSLIAISAVQDFAAGKVYLDHLLPLIGLSFA